MAMAAMTYTFPMAIVKLSQVADQTKGNDDQVNQGRKGQRGQQDYIR